MVNTFSRIVSKINNGPEFCRSFLLTKLFCTKVKYAGTSNVVLESVEPNRVELFIANKKKVQNHIGGVHAIAVALLAESATGIVVGLNVPDDRLPVLKSMTVNFERRMQGALRAVATLTDEQITQIRTTEKGETLVDVVITDESEQSPVSCEMHWAWITKVRKPKSQAT